MQVAEYLKSLQIARMEMHRDSVPLVALKTQALTAAIQATKLAVVAMGGWVPVDGVNCEAVGASEHVLTLLPGELGMKSTVSVDVSAEDSDFAMVTVTDGLCRRYIVRRHADDGEVWGNHTPTWTLEMTATER